MSRCRVLQFTFALLTYFCFVADVLFLLQGYGPAVKAEDEDRHMNVNVTSSGQGTKTVILQIPKVLVNQQDDTVLAFPVFSFITILIFL